MRAKLATSAMLAASHFVQHCMRSYRQSWFGSRHSSRSVLLQLAGWLLVCAATPALAQCPLDAAVPTPEFRKQITELAGRARETAMQCLQQRIAAAPSTAVVPTALLRVDLSKMAEDTGDFVAAERYVKQAVQALEPAQHERELSEALRRFGWLEFRRGNYSAAQGHMQRALQLATRALGPKHLDVGTTSAAIGNFAVQQGDYATAESAFERALAIAATGTDLGHRQLQARTHAYLATLEYNRDDFSRSIDQNHAARELYLAIQAADTPQLAAIYHNLANGYRALGVIDSAQHWEQRSLDALIRIYGPDHVNVATSVEGLGNLARMQGALGESRRYYERARAILEKSVGPWHPGAAYIETALGNLDLDMGQPRAALTHFERSVAIRERPDAAGQDLLAVSVRDLARARLRLGQVQQARGDLERAITLAMVSSSRQSLWEAYAEYAQVQARQRALPAAVFFGKQAIEMIQAARAELAALGRPVQYSFLEHRSDAYRAAADHLITLGRLPEAQQVLNMLKEEEYLGFVRSLSVSGDHGTTRVPATAEEQVLAEPLQRLTAELRDMPYAAAHARVSAELRRITGALASAARPGTSRTTLTAAEPVEPGSATLRYVVTEDRLRVLVSTPRGLGSFDIAVPAARLNASVFELRGLLQSPRTDPKPQAAALYDTLIRPLQVRLAAERIQRLRVIADGTLRYLPFAALHDGERYLVERYQLEVTTPAVAAQRPGSSRLDDRIAAFGVTKPASNLPPLPRVATELERIVRRDARDRDGVLPGTVALDEAFSATQLQQSLDQQFPVVHIASHFVFHPGPVGQSYLLLGGERRLTLDELRSPRFSLQHVELLTLSACETAVGQPSANGEEFESFGVLAQRQGARAVLATLWRVADLSTANFMVRFYGERRSADSAAALHRTQLRFLQESTAYRHPFYWAPYVLMSPAPQPR